MMRASATLCLFSSLAVFAQARTVAITVDDLPYAAGAGVALSSTAEIVNRKLLAAFRTHHVPVTGFVIQKGVESFGDSGTRILKEWIAQGFDLGNHTYSHPDINDLSVEQIEQEIVRGESALGPLMKEAGKSSPTSVFP